MRAEDRSSASEQPPQIEDRSRPDEPRELIHAAESVGEVLLEKAVRRADGSVAWLAPAPAGAAPPRALGPHLYDGASGIAFFLAALARLSGDSDVRVTARTAIEPLRRTLEALVDDPERSEKLGLPIGGLVGLGGFLYTLARVGAWLEDPALLDTCRRAASLVTPERIEQDRRLDVTSGSAGAILVFLALDAVVGGPLPNGETALSVATRCGRHLLDRRVSIADRPRAWPGVDRPPISGFGHGAAGIAYALLRLYARTGEEGLKEAALEGVSFERSLYVQEETNWIDPRSNEPLEQSAWCHGAPGIALGRAAALPLLDDPALTADLGPILDAVRSMDDTPVDHLCCGNMGRADVLWTAGRALGESSLLADAAGVASRAVRLAQARGGRYRLRIEDQEPGSELSLFRGLAGVGYVLLRLSRPDDFPSVLLLG